MLVETTHLTQVEYCISLADVGHTVFFRISIRSQHYQNFAVLLA